MSHSVIQLNRYRSVVAAAVLSLIACLAGASNLFAQGATDTSLKPADAMQTMMLTSKAFRAAAEKIRPSLVTIEAYGGVASVQGKIGGIKSQGEGNTTGVIVSADGYIVTSTFNFIQKPPVITVVMSDNERHTARLMGQDKIRKICLLKVDGVSDLALPEIVDPKTATVGQWAISVGLGYGDTSPALSMGVISAKNRIGGKAIQTDANISPANYGGPLIDIHGRMLGVCVPMDPQSQAVGAGVQWYDSGIGFAVPIDFDSAAIERLKKEGVEIAPPFLGMKMITIDGREGLWVEVVVPESPADKAGIRREDFIREINGEKVSDVLALRRILNQFESGEEVELTVWFEETEKVEKRKLILASPPKPPTDLPVLEPPQVK